MKESDIVLDVIKTRRSVRRFDGIKIPGECTALAVYRCNGKRKTQIYSTELLL